MQRAFVLVYLNKAELIHAYEDSFLRSIESIFPSPSVIKIKNYVSKPYRGVLLNRQNVFRRDDFTCQYCGSLKKLTIDHIVPKSKGGKTTWKNVITACESCNMKKGNTDLENCGMTLRRQAYKPSPFIYLFDKNGKVREEWISYLNR
jgi:5-methylcytosine-specific restriction endonuclease McrA